ncbi:hypothetical protein L2E82_34678 [Cichorium intybus]|uniref:Uncharacterized protein n=1 Tax=Cichorium intybus TaxID=13427 RepID=A0ACB9BMI2_CICIN|nr:hypothetical protein L2E82_34678 [Cichorium intybus]
MSRRLHGCNNESGTWNCNIKNEMRRLIQMLTSGETVVVIETLLGAEIIAKDSMKQTHFEAWGVKVDIPEFDGKAQPVDFIDWLSTVERVFGLKDIHDNYNEGKSKVETWTKMRKLLCDKFLPVNYRQEAFLEYHSLSQWTSTMEEFIAEFDKSRMRCGAEEPEEQLIARFLGAQRHEISDIIQLQPCWSFTDVCSLALKVERQSKNKSKVTPSKFGTARTESLRFPVKFSPNNGSKVSLVKAETSCTAALPSPNVSRLSRCFKCQGIGHFAWDCPNQQLHMLTEETLTEDTQPVHDTKVEEEAEESEILYPDKGQSLVTQRVLSNVSTPSVDSTLWLRNNIF